MTTGVLVSLTIGGMGVLAYSSSNQRSAYFSSTSSSSFHLAEAGINEALALLNAPGRNPLDPTLVPETTSVFPQGSVTWSGALIQDPLDSPHWSLTATARSSNPTGPTADITRTVTAEVPIAVQTIATLEYDAWRYVYSSNSGTPGGCDLTLDQSIDFGSPLYVTGNLCLETPSRVLGPLVVQGSVRLDQNTNIGTSASPIASVQIAGGDGSLGFSGCKFTAEPAHNPCHNGSPPNPPTRDGDEIWVEGLAQSTSASPVLVPNGPPVLDAPVADFESWYTLASPGPHSPCGLSSGVSPSGTAWESGFDVDKTRNVNMPLSNLTPGGRSYSCQTAAGELSWDASSRKLVVDGVVFIDGHAKIDANVMHEYDGVGTIYLSGTFQLQNGELCAVVKGSSCDWDAWDPDSEMLAIVADGSNGPSPMATQDSIFLRSTQFQGALYGTGVIEIDTSSDVQGPMVAPTVVNGNTVLMRSFPPSATVPIGLPGQAITGPAELGAPTIYPN